VLSLTGLSTLTLEKTTMYNHMFSINFTVKGSTDYYGGDITPEQFRAAINKRMDDLDSEGELAWDEGIGLPLDTYEEHDD